MKKILLFLSLSGFIFSANAYDKLTLVERFTNASCVPCAQINSAWYNSTIQNYINNDQITHIVYNVWWPGANDPMYLLNQADNTSRTSYYGCNYVPWIDVNGTKIAETQAALVNAVTSGNSEFAPFKLVITQGVISNSLIEIGVKIIRDPIDVTTFGNVKLRVALTEKTVTFPYPPGGNGESVFHSVSRKMLPNASGTSFTVPAPGDSIMITLQYVPTAAFLQAVNMDSIRVVAFIQDDNNRKIHQSNYYDINRNYMATINSPENFYFGASTETAVYSAYLKNIGLFQDTYNVNLAFDGPGGWLLSFTTINGTFNLGQTDVLTLNPGDSTEIFVNVNANAINGYGKTLLNFLSNQGSFGNTEFTFTTFGLKNLVVDDDGGADYENYFLTQLENMSVEFGAVPSDYLLNKPNSINTFDAIIWNTGITTPGLNSNEISLLKTFLDNGGGLYLNGVDLPYQLADPSSPYYTSETNDFFTNYLHSNYILRNHPTTIVSGISGDPITNGIGMMTLIGGSGANTINHSAGRYVNRISAEGTNSANILAFWQKPDEHPAIRAFHGISGKVVFTAFGFETIALAERRTLFAQRIVDWLNTPVNVEGNPEDYFPSSFSLEQNYPNPFNPVTFIKYRVPEASFVTIKVYDLIGREVAILVNEIKNPGSYQVTFDSENLASGVYFYKMIAGDFSSVKKMNLLK